MNNFMFICMSCDL